MNLVVICYPLITVTKQGQTPDRLVRVRISEANQNCLVRVTIYGVPRLRVPDIVLEIFSIRPFFAILHNVCKIYFMKTCVEEIEELK